MKLKVGVNISAFEVLLFEDLGNPERSLICYSCPEDWVVQISAFLVNKAGSIIDKIQQTDW